MSWIIFIFGLIVGSFLNALIHRLDSGESMTRDRSRCVYCHHVLGAGDLIPLVSYIWLRGRCRYCGQTISWQYPLIELLTGTGFMLAFWQVGLVWQLIPACVFIAFLIVVGMFDYRHFLILDKVVYP